MKTKRSHKYIVISIFTLLLCMLAALLAVKKINRYYLEFDVSEDTIYLEYGVDEMPEINALCKGTLINRKGTPVETTMDGNLDITKLGTYEATYTANYQNLSLKETLTVIVQDTIPPEIQLVSNLKHYTSPVGTYEEEGFSATDNYDGDITSQVTSEEHDGIVTYKVTDSSGNETTVDRTITYKDKVSPTITLNEGEVLKLSSGTDFVDPGFAATDDCDGDLTQNVTVEGTVDGRTDGTYILKYYVEDSSGNVARATRTVLIGDFTPPVITLLNTGTSSNINAGDPYPEPGYTAIDNVDGDITSKVRVSGSVDTSKAGSYTLTYTVTDNNGNTSTATRTVYISQAE